MQSTANRKRMSAPQMALKEDSSHINTAIIITSRLLTARKQDVANSDT
jgi:hypothetical protein